jgi:hypothetical protein
VYRVESLYHQRADPFNRSAQMELTPYEIVAAIIQCHRDSLGLEHNPGVGVAGQAAMSHQHTSTLRGRSLLAALTSDANLLALSNANLDGCGLAAFLRLSSFCALVGGVIP